MSCVFQSLESGLVEHLKELDASRPPTSSTKFMKVWLSEVDAVKRLWGMGINASPDCCAFGDVTQLQNGHAWCYRHDQYCVVVRAECIIGGFSDIRDNLGLLGFSWTHWDSLGPTWTHLDSLGLGLVSLSSHKGKWKTSRGEMEKGKGEHPDLTPNSTRQPDGAHAHTPRLARH